MLKMRFLIAWHHSLYVVIYVLRKLGWLCVDSHKLKVWDYTHGFISFTLQIILMYLHKFENIEISLTEIMKHVS